VAVFGAICGTVSRRGRRVSLAPTAGAGAACAMRIGDEARIDRGRLALS
jgi:hypothetical protein